MIRLWSSAVIALALGGIVHISAVQLVPWVDPQPARDRLAALGGELAFHTLRSDVTTQDLDPAFRYAVCLFDLSAGPVVIEAALGSDYWGLSLHDGRGSIFYALNNRSAEQGRLTLVVVPQEQADRIARTFTERNDPRLVVGAPVARGYVTLKLFVPSPSRAAEAGERLRLARCRKLDAAA